MTYRPLPDGLIIKESNIEGLGLFSLKTIPKGTVLGTSHIKDSRFENGYIRTPLGGFVNHSDNPNVETIGPGKSRDIDTGIMKLKTLADIKPLDELTLNYTLYKPS